MSYCDGCILEDICCAEGKDDESMTFCADKDRFIEKVTRKGLMDRGIELVSIGRIETKDVCLLETLKENGFYLKYEKMPKYDREYYIIMAPKED